MGKHRELTNQHLLFVEAIMAGNNGCQSAIMAGFSASSARTQASRLLARDSIKDEIARRREVVIDELDLNPERVIKRLMTEMDGLGKDTNAGARIKAAELLAKIQGMLTPDSQVNVQVNNQIHMPPPLVVRGVSTSGYVTDGTTIDQYDVEHNADDIHDSS